MLISHVTNFTAHADNTFLHLCQVSGPIIKTAALSAYLGIIISYFFLFHKTSTAPRSIGTRWANIRSMAQPEWGARINYQDRWSAISGCASSEIKKFYYKFKTKISARIYEANNQYIEVWYMRMTLPSYTTYYDWHINLLFISALVVISYVSDIDIILSLISIRIPTSLSISVVSSSDSTDIE
jgi:hypothetical protein